MLGSRILGPVTSDHVFDPSGHGGSLACPYARIRDGGVEGKRHSAQFRKGADMLDRLFPKTFDNTYRGHWLGIWIFTAVALVKAVQGVNSIIITRMVATN